jgi:hypothetical protein
MDGQFPSYLHLVPPMEKVGTFTQYLTSGANEYILTEEWREPYHRWSNLLETLRNTDVPRRVYPINVYFHFYIADKSAALFSTYKIFDWVLRQQPAGLWVTQYIDIVRDFADIRLARLPSSGGQEMWRVLNSGYCRTIRFDRFNRYLDLRRSRGVIGYRRLKAQRALYVHLDESNDHLIALSTKPSRDPYLVRASAYIRDLSITRKRIGLVLRGFGRKYLTFMNLRPLSWYRVVARNNQGRVLRSRVITDSGGTFHWQGDINGSKISLSIRHDGGR